MEFDTGYFGEVYRAEKQPNGKYSVYDVPIFSETYDDREEPHFHFDENWLSMCVQYLKDMEDRKHFKPVILGHHRNIFENKIPVGKIVNARLGDYGPYGKTIFVDLRDIDPEVFQLMEEGKLPYRSVEINDPNKPEISCLALLSSIDPYHPYPNMIAKEESLEGSFFCKSKNGSTWAFTSYKKEKTMPKAKSKKFMEGPEPSASNPEPASQNPEPSQVQGGEVSKEEFEALKAQVENLSKMIQQIMESKPVSPEPPVANPEPAQMQRLPKSVFAKIGSLEAEIAKMRMAMKEEAANSEVENLISELRKANAVFNEEDVRKTARMFAKISPEALEAYGNSLLANAVPAPISPEATSPTEETHPVLKKYSNDPEALSYAKSCIQMYQANRDGMSLSLEDFVEGQVGLHFQKRAK